MPDEANSSTTSATLAGLSLSDRWRLAAHKQDELQMELVRRNARASLFEEPHQHVALGRYAVLGKIGQGGMGTVYAAFDPQLDRKVALKVLFAGESGGTSDGHQRLLREAQALAQLTHPNVVSIYDVGSFEVTRTAVAEDGTEPSVFIAMELVDGTTLTRWLAQPRPWRDVLDVMLQAARGVSAAHAKGLVHRDFKPDNVMVGADGRVRVMDFGLARTTGGRTVPETPTGQSVLGLDITTAGALVGTPAYMAPEQHAGLEADARSDQFAFCVATWEAVYGARPFAGDSLIELATAVLEGRMRDRPRSVNVPAWLRRALERGLASEPAKRWASMDALLSELEQGRARASRRRLGIIVSGLVGVVLAVLAGRAIVRAEALRACDEAAAAGSPWNEDVRTQVHDAILASGLAYAPTTARLVTPWLDGFADTWTEARASACRAREVEQTWDADTYERSLWCLDERRMDLEALVGELTDADADAVRGAVWAAASLSGIATCVDEARLHRLPPPPRRDELVESVRGELARARAATAAARASEGLARAKEALDHARTLGSPRLLATAHGEVGAALELLGNYPDSVLALREAYFVAAAAGEVELAETNATSLARVLGTSLDAYDDGEIWLRLADIEDARLADPEGLRDAARLTVRGNIRQHAGDIEAARLDHQHAVEIYEQVLGDEHPAVARALQGLATTEIALGHYEEARQLHERGLAVLEHALGRNHPDVAMVLHNLATAELALGRYAEADERFAEVGTLLEASLGPEHPKLVGVLTNRATARRLMGDPGEARRLLARALAIAEHSLGPDHTTVAAVLNNMAVVEEAEDHWDEALALHERALAIRQRVLPSGHADIARSLANVANAAEATGDVARARASFEQAIPALEAALGPDHTDLAQVISNLAILHGHAGEHAKSLELHERALVIWERALGPEHPDVALALTALGKELFAAGRAEAAIEPLQRARRIRERPPIDAAALAETHFALAEALWRANEDRRGALGYARRALEEYRSAAVAGEDSANEIGRWIATHEPQQKIGRVQ